MCTAQAEDVLMQNEWMLSDWEQNIFSPTYSIKISTIGCSQNFVTIKLQGYKSVLKLNYYPVLTVKGLHSFWFSLFLLFTVSLSSQWKADCCSSPGWHSDTATAPAGPTHTEAANYENVALCPQWHHTSLMWHKIRT